MHKFAIAVATGACLAGAAIAADPADFGTRARAFLDFRFDGPATHAPRFFYGLRLDQTYRDADVARPPLAQLQFDRRGFAAATVNGMPVVQRLVLNQNETTGEPAAEAAPVEEAPADAAPAEEAPAEAASSEATAAEAAPADAAPADEPPAEEYAAADESGSDESTGEGGGGERSYSALDWGLIIIGVAGVGYAVSEIASTDESPDPAPSGGDGGTTTGGGSTTGGGGPIPCPPPPLPQIPGCTPLLTGGYGSLVEERIPSDYLEWLDGGTGQMGDIGG